MSRFDILQAFPIQHIDIGEHEDLDIWTDCHKRSDMAINFKPDKNKKNVILLGDNIDISREKKKNIDDARDEEADLIAEYGLHYFTGNHSRAKDIDVYRKIKQFPHVACGHGDSIAKGYQWSHDYRFGDAGAGVFKRKIWTNFLEGIQQNWGGKLDLKELDRAVEIADHVGSRVLLIGHCHPTEHLTYEHKRIVVECFERGRTNPWDLTQYSHLKGSR